MNWAFVCGMLLGSFESCDDVLGIQLMQKQSATWLEQPKVKRGEKRPVGPPEETGVPTFSLRFSVDTWIVGERVRLRFPGEEIEIDKTVEVELVEVGEDAAIVELGPQPKERLEFLIMGTGSTLRDPVTSCSGDSVGAAPAPTPPGMTAASVLIDCDLYPTYNLVESWDVGASIRIDFAEWSHLRLFKLFFRNSPGLTTLKINKATNVKIFEHEGGTEFQFNLNPACSGTVTDESGKKVHVAGSLSNCVDANPLNWYISWQMVGAPHSDPTIACNGEHPPPPPRPPHPHPPPPPYIVPFPSPVPSPPPPPPHVVRTASTCPSSGHLVERYTLVVADAPVLGLLKRRVSVILSSWLEGYVAVIGVTGTLLNVEATEGAFLASVTVDESRPYSAFLNFVLRAGSIHGLLLSAQAKEFAFTLIGVDSDIHSLDCRKAEEAKGEVVFPPPPPSPIPHLPPRPPTRPVPLEPPLAPPVPPALPPSAPPIHFEFTWTMMGWLILALGYVGLRLKAVYFDPDGSAVVGATSARATPGGAKAGSAETYRCIHAGGSKSASLVHGKSPTKKKKKSKRVDSEKLRALEDGEGPGS